MHPLTVQQLLEKRDRTSIQTWMPFWEWVYQVYFRVQTSGWEHVPSGKVLFVGSHNGGLAAPDLYMFMVDWFRRFGYDRLIYGLMHRKVWQVNPQAADYAARLGAVPAEAKVAIAALHQGASVLVYPGGAQDVFRPHSQRNQIHLANRKGFIKLALRENVPIVPLVAHGAHDTLIVLGDLYKQLKQLNEWGLLPWWRDIDPEVFPIYLGLPWGVALGPLPNIPLPAQIYTHVCKPVRFERYGRESAQDLAYVDKCYERVEQAMQAALDNLAK
ncbi:MAG: lysophospholipid acyltransferase family protein [Cyanobacteria bacterium P01_F01_bin.4]